MMQRARERLRKWGSALGFSARRGKAQGSANFSKGSIFNEIGYTKPVGAASKLWYEWEEVLDDLQQMNGLDIYRKMQHDPDVKSAIALKVGGVVGADYELIPARQDTEADYPQAKEQADFIRYCFDKMAGSLNDVLKEVIQDGVAQGIGISEPVYMYNTSLDEFGGKVIYKAIKAKDPVTFDYKLDEFNNLVGLRICVGSEIHDVDPQKFAIFSYNSRYGKPVGDSDLRGAYKWFWAKQKAFEFWLLYAEKFGSPMLWGKARQGSTMDKKQALLKALVAARNESAIVTEVDEEVEILEGSQKQGDAYQGLLDFCTRQIAKAIIGNTLTTDQSSNSTGSYAQAKVHQDVLLVFVQELRKKAEDYVNERYIKTLIDINYPDPMYPKFSLGSVDDKDIAGLSTAIQTLVNTGVVSPVEGWIRDFVGVPEASAEDLQKIADKEAEEEAKRAEMQQRLASFPAIGDKKRYPEQG